MRILIKPNETQQEKLEIYKNLLIKWNRSINLISETSVAQIWDRHIQDSWQLVSIIEPKPVLTDFGSGAGFPGLVLAIADAANEVRLIEADKRKASFLREVIARLGLKAKVFCERIERIESWKSDVITARALAPLPELLEYISDFYKDSTEIWLLKGIKLKEELGEARKSWKFKEDITATDAGYIIKITDLTHAL